MYQPTQAFPAAGKVAGDISQFDIEAALAEYLQATYPDAVSGFSMADTIADEAVIDTRITTTP